MSAVRRYIAIEFYEQYGPQQRMLEGTGIVPVVFVRATDYDALQRDLATVQEIGRLREALSLCVDRLIGLSEDGLTKIEQVALSTAQAALAQPAAPSAPAAGSVDHPETEFGVKGEAPSTSIAGKCVPPSQWDMNAQVRGDIT